MPLVPPIITARFASYRAPCVFSLRRLGRFADFELFDWILDAMAAVKEVLN
jgi:hypothetical protein